MGTKMGGIWAWLHSVLGHVIKFEFKRRLLHLDTELRSKSIICLAGQLWLARLVDDVIEC